MEFHISDVLSITTGRLVSSRKMEGIYKILNHMTGTTCSPINCPALRGSANLCW